ncbi:MAG TPA: enoyl-CoA hydratase/isomerase family protein [Gaiellaceae bacterium]|jgi:enoyl-CoA hydratase|nr:enoyl-CoA hydratase/isomerase family protein [Gaiellaceae bacterium]
MASTDASTSTVLLSQPLPGVAVMTLNRPEVRNPLDIDSVLAAHGILDALESAPEPLRVFVVTGAAPAFSAGGDLTKYLDLYRARDDFEHFLGELGRLLERLEQGPYVSMAMINGVCAAGGLELVLACDFAIAAESAMIGDLHIKYAQLPGAGGSQRLVRAVGVSRAKDILLSGRLMSSTEAAAIGLISRAVPDDSLDFETLRLAEQLTTRSPECIARMKRLVTIAAEEPLSRGLQLEREVVADYATTSPDALEGLLAFAENRLPVFEDR